MTGRFSIRTNLWDYPLITAEQCTCTCVCSRCCKNTQSVSPPPYTKDQVSTSTKDETSEAKLEVSPDLEARMKELGKRCPKCLEQVTKKRYFDKEPEHNYIYPTNFPQYEPKRPAKVADMSKPIGWWTRFRVKYREDDLVSKRRMMDIAENCDKRRSFLLKCHARFLRSLEKSCQRYDFERSLE